MLGLSSGIFRLVHEHVPAFIVWLCVWAPVPPSRDVEDAVILSTPCRASRVLCGEDDVLEVLPFRTEYHHSIGRIHCDPQVAVGAARWTSISLYH